jgi:hypothetical protein
MMTEAPTMTWAPILEGEAADRADAAIMALIKGHQIRAIDLPEDTDSSLTSGLMDRII